MKSQDGYQQALDYIYSFVDYSRTRQENLAPENFDLARMFAFMQSLGNPQNDYASIHVAGSKGKGSVSSMCAAVLHAAGHKVGLYTSPHMQDFTERIQVNLAHIPGDALAELVEEIKPHVANVPKLTTFEIITGLAFLYFSRQQVDMAVFEVGLGGRLDATNIIVPKVSVITSLSLEHTSILGNSLAAIAGEKSGIIKPGIPVVVSPQEEEALAVVRSTAQASNSQLIQIGQDYQFAPIAHSLDGQSLRIWRDNEEDAVELNVALLGDHQIVNAVCAYASLQTLADTGFDIPLQAIMTGLAKVEWPGRFEVISSDPLIVIDSAHNLESAQKLSHTVKQYFPDRDPILIFGCSEDKDAAGILAALGRDAQHIIATRSLHPRAMLPEEIYKLAQDLKLTCTIAPLIEDAYEAALDLVTPQSLILIAGSVFIAGAGRAAWAVRQSDEQRV